MSTPSVSASAVACGLGRTLKPMMIAVDAAASMTSDSLMPPTPEWMMRTLTSGCWILSSASLSASRLPWTSALTTRLRSRTLPAAMRAKTSSSVSACCLASASVLMPVGALLAERARGALVLDDAAELAGDRQLVEADDLDRRRRTARLERLAAEVAHGAHLAAGLAGDDGVADAERAAADQHGRHDAAARVDLGLDDEPAGRRFGVGLEVADLGHEQEHVEEVVEADALLGAGLDEDVVAAPLLGHDAVLGELLLDALDVGVGLVDLVDDDDDGHLRRLGVVDGLDASAA